MASLVRRGGWFMIGVSLLAAAPAPPFADRELEPGTHQVLLEAAAFRRVESGHGLAYYRLVDGPGGTVIRGDYRPGMETVTLATEIPQLARATAQRLRWRWRVLALPEKGDECRSGYTDSAGVVYVTWKSGLAWKSLKYVWSTAGRLGVTCDTKRWPFAAQDTVILESGGPIGAWREEDLDLRAAYREHFAGHDPQAEVPGLRGIGILTDGDQTQSPAAAEFAGFEVEY